MTLGCEFANMLGFVLLVAFNTAILESPVALLTIAISEIGKIDRLWFSLVAGALAAVPALFRGDYMTLRRMIEDFMTLGPFGAVAGAACWMVRHHKWPA